MTVADEIPGDGNEVRFQLIAALYGRVLKRHGGHSANVEVGEMNNADGFGELLGVKGGAREASDRQKPGRISPFLER